MDEKEIVVTVQMGLICKMYQLLSKSGSLFNDSRSLNRAFVFNYDTQILIDSRRETRIVVWAVPLSSYKASVPFNTKSSRQSCRELLTLLPTL